MYARIVMPTIIEEIKKENTRTEPIPRKTYSLTETAQCLGVSYATVFRLVQRGKLKTSGDLRTKLITVMEIDRYLKSTTV